MATESMPFGERLKQGLKKWLATAIIATITLTGLGLLQAWGDRVFDATVAALGKQRFLQLILVLLCILGYFAYHRVVQHRKKKLHRHREVYWGRKDSMPYCPFCYERDAKEIHLAGPTSLHARKAERWDCKRCYHPYVSAKPGDRF